jgi:integrase
MGVFVGGTRQNRQPHVPPTIRPNGGRLWRLKYRVAAREKLLAIGVYPDVSLAKARERRDEARRLLVNQVDPNAREKAERQAQSSTFEVVAREWLELQRPDLTPKTFAKKLGWFEDFLYPYIGRHPIAQITSPDLLAALKRIEARGHRETAHRARSSAGNVLRYAIATGRAERDISADLRGQPTTESALQLAPLLFVRPGELRAAEWVEFSLDAEHPHWRIPGSRMKMGEEHRVPLARQAIAILREIGPVTGGGRYVFPSLRGGHRPISENTINIALRSMGYSGEQITGHGFRAMASTCLNEQAFPPDLIELQLAHGERNEVRAAYNRAKRIPERRSMMQAWADYLDRLRCEGDSTTIVSPTSRPENS